MYKLYYVWCTRVTRNRRDCADVVMRAKSREHAKEMLSKSSYKNWDCDIWDVDKDFSRNQIMTLTKNATMINM